MATYKKRGYKPRTAEEQDIAVEEQSTTAEVFNTLDEGAGKTEAWVAKNQKYIFIIIGAAALVVLGYLGYKQFIQEPKEAEAANEMFQAQQYFEAALTAPATESDSLFTLALNGGEGKFGFLDIIEEYSGTDAANIARYSAGMAYLNINKYQEAIEHLDDFKSDDIMLSALAKGAIGDSFLQLGQADEALGYYSQAASEKANTFTTPRFLLKAAITALDLGEAGKAEDFLTRIKEEFPDSPQADQVDVYLGQAKAMN